MIQKVNLYTEELRPRKEKLQAGTALAVLVLAVLVVLVAAGVARYQGSELTAQIQEAEQQSRQLEASVETLTEELRARQPDPEVEAALQRVTETIERRQRLLERVESLITTRSHGFSPAMEALARQVPESVWLTGISLNALTGHVALVGRTRSGSQVPLYLENLGEEPAFSGKNFGSFRLERGEDGRWIEFHVATDQASGGDL